MSFDWGVNCVDAVETEGADSEAWGIRPLYTRAGLADLEVGAVDARRKCWRDFGRMLGRRSWVGRENILALIEKSLGGTGGLCTVGIGLEKRKLNG